MTEFSHKERFALSSAEGWLMLGCPAEAAEELKVIGHGSLLDSPQVLCVRWAISFRLKRWTEAQSIARLWCA